MNSLFQYPIDMLDDVLAWAHDMMFQADRHMEPMVFVRRGMLGEAAATATVIGPTLAYSREQAREIVSILEAFPQRHRAIRQDIAEETEFEGLMAPTEEFYPQGSRYHVDNMWTEANVADLLPGMRDIAATLPDSPSHMMWMLWGQPQTLPDMAFSMQAPLYVGLYAVGQDPTSDSRGRDWSTGHMRRLEPFASGIQLADENLGRRPFRFMAPPNLQRLQAIRAVRDPDGLFHSWMAMPA